MRVAARMAAATESATLAVQQAAAALRARGVNVIDLGVGEPDFAAPRTVIDGARGALDGGHTRYTATAGIPELRDAIARDYAMRFGTGWARESVVVSAGAKQALYNLCLATLDPGDEVLVPAPCWVSVPDQIRLVGAVPVFVPADWEGGFVPDPARIERAVGPRTRAIFLNSPCNPTGAVIPRNVLAAVAAIASTRDLLLVSDETYDHFVYPPAEHVSAAAFHGELGPRLVIVNSFSKTYAMTGLRVGYLIAAPAIAAAATTLQGHTTSNASSVSQRAALGALTGPQDAVGEMRREYAIRRELVTSGLQAIPGVELQPPGGAFYAFPRVVEAMRKLGVPGSVALAERLLAEAAVAVVPGAPFEGEGFIRISFAASREALAEGVGRIARVLGAGS